MVDAIVGSPRFFRSGEINVSVTSNKEKNLNTTDYAVDGNTITPVGKFVVWGGWRQGEIASFEPNIIESPGTSFKNASGNVRTPSEKFEATSYKLGYGLQLPVAGYTMTGGFGYGKYDANTPDKTHGLDATNISVHGESATVAFEKSSHSLALGYKQNQEDVMSGQKGYTVYRERNSTDKELKGSASISPELTLKASLNWKTTGQAYTFGYDTGVPHFFPAKSADESQQKFGINVEKKDFAGLNSAEIGVSMTQGSAISTLLSVPVSDALGASVQMTTENGTQIELTFDQMSASGTGSYFKADDLDEHSKTSKLGAIVKTDTYSLGVSYATSEKGGHFNGATPVDALLATFPEASQHTTSWKERTLTLSGFYKVLSNVSVLAEYVRSGADLNQYGAQTGDIKNIERVKIGLGISF